MDNTTDEVEQALSESLITELYQQVSEHYLRISFVEALQLVKEKLPKTKKQALRAKIEGATSRKSVSLLKERNMETAI